MIFKHFVGKVAILQVFLFKIDEKIMKNEKNQKMFSVNFSGSGLKTPFPGSISASECGDTINLSFENMDFRNFPLYFYRIC